MTTATTATPTIPPPGPGTLNSSLRRNIEVLAQRREQEAVSATREQRIAQVITNFTGSMWFVYLHLALYGAWIMLNLGIVSAIPPSWSTSQRALMIVTPTRDP